MAKIGVKDLFAWEIKKEEEGKKPEYGEPFRVAKAIQVTMTPQLAEGSLYADDSIDEYESAITGYDVSMNTNDLDSGKEAILLGKKVDENGGIISSTEDEAPYFAIGFRIKRSKGAGGGYQYRILYKVRFVPFSEDFQTQGENIQFQTPTITGKSLSRDVDGVFNYKLDDDGKKDAIKAITKEWFKKVTEPGEIKEPGTAEPGEEG